MAHGKLRSSQLQQEFCKYCKTIATIDLIF